MMKSRPILFSTPMVQAILEGRKTQTRRICKNQHVLEMLDGKAKVIPSYFNEYQHGFCPYGIVDDQLWVRETFQEYKKEFYYKASSEEIGNRQWGIDIGLTSKLANYKIEIEDLKWKPSIFMPREACRINLEITEIKVEHLHEISEQDSVDEGIKRIWNDKPLSVDFNNYTIEYPIKNPYASHNTETAKECFKFLWEQINGKPSWDSNPFVWVIKFKKI